MKPVSSSDVDVEWVVPQTIYTRSAFNQNLYPSKTVIAFIAQIERGNFPVVEVHSTIDGAYVTQKTARIYEAYLRCHFSRVPVVYVEKDRNDRDSV